MICQFCGDAFESQYDFQKYCSRDCSKDARNQKRRWERKLIRQQQKADPNYHPKPRGRKKEIPRETIKPKESLAEIQRLARAAGLSYGQYMARRELNNG